MTQNSLKKREDASRASVDERKDKHGAMMTSVGQIKEREGVREREEGRKEEIEESNE